MSTYYLESREDTASETDHFDRFDTSGVKGDLQNLLRYSLRRS